MIIILVRVDCFPSPCKRRYRSRTTMETPLPYKIFRPLLVIALRRSWLGNPQLVLLSGGANFRICFYFFKGRLSAPSHKVDDRPQTEENCLRYLCHGYQVNFPSPYLMETRNSHSTIQFYPCICLSLRFSIALLPLSDLPLFCRAMFPYRFSPFG